ncbi:MAG: CapA family protein [Patescibacteria group bacterium]
MSFQLKSKLKYFFWILLSILTGILLASIATKTASYEKIEQKNTNQEQIESVKDETLKTFYFIKDTNKKPNAGAESYYVGDLDTGEVILEKNKDKKFSIASITKLMTAIVSLDNQNQEEITQITKSALAPYGKNGGFRLNEKIKIGDLIYPLLLESSNDAAQILALNSGINTFIKKMNEKAKILEMLSTSFIDPSGLSENNQSTAFDLFKFSQYLKSNEPALLQVTLEKSFGNKKHVWFNNSQFLGLEGYQGGKRGYIDGSKQTAVSFFTLPLGKEGLRNIGIIVLRSPDRYKDIKNILNYLRKNVYHGGKSDADMAWVKTKENIFNEEEQNFVTLLFGGDVMLDRGVKNSVNKNFNGDYSVLFKNLDILKNADIAFINLEGPASDQGKDRRNLYSFRMDPSIIPALRGAGISILSLANNHIGDWGRNAFSDTITGLKENEILYIGGGMNDKEAEQPVVIEKYGMKIGYLAFSDTGPNWMKADENNPGILLANNPRFEKIITSAAKQVNFLIVSFHFGDEYKTKHNQRQEYLAHLAIDNGAKIIIGTHSHLIQDTEIYKNGFIAYSLGNFIFDQYFSENTMQGMLLEIKLNRDGTMLINKNTVKLNKAFQPEKVIKGKEEKIKF